MLNLASCGSTNPRILLNQPKCCKTWLINQAHQEKMVATFLPFFRCLFKKSAIFKEILKYYFKAGEAQHRGSIRAHHPAAQGFSLGTPENLFWTESYLATLLYQWTMSIEQTHLVSKAGVSKSSWGVCQTSTPKSILKQMVNLDA